MAGRWRGTVALGIGTLAIFLVLGLLPIRGLKGFGIKFLLLAVLGVVVYQLPHYWEPFFEAGFEIPEGPLQDKLGYMIGGGILGPIGAVIGLIAAAIMAIFFRKKAE